ncbi:hypothetical protein BDF19DRAFT_422341 [Syncephalis fuscata]|nr:hypothetical protein BDF19DRAFT_422341 [Syncephalis fuscata]
MSYQSRNEPLHEHHSPRHLEEYAAPLPPPPSSIDPYSAAHPGSLPVPPKAQTHGRSPSGHSINRISLNSSSNTTGSTSYQTNRNSVNLQPPPMVVVQQPTAHSAMLATSSNEESHIGASLGGGSGGSQRRDALNAIGLATSDEADDGAHGRVKNSGAAADGWRPNGYSPYGNDSLARALADEEAQEKRDAKSSCCCCCCGTRGTEGAEATCCVFLLCCGLGQMLGFR